MIRTTVTFNKIKIYIDLDAAKIIIGRDFLLIFEYLISTKYITKIRRVNGRLLKFTK